MAPSQRDRTRFRALLSRFKRSGCNLLIVGEPDPATRRAASRRLFGARDADRERLLVVTDDADPDAWCPAPGATVRAADHAHGAAGIDPAELRAAVDRELPDRSLSAGRLRVGVTDLSPLVREGGADAVRGLTGAVRGRNGMGHYHHFAPSADGLPAAVVDAFDATLELRRADEGPEERWHVPEASLTTEWLPLAERT